MISPLESFGGSLPPPDKDLALGRIAWQDAQLSPVVGDLVLGLAECIDTQEERLVEIYRPLLVYIREVITNQNTILNQIAIDIRTNAITRVEGQGAALRSFQTQWAGRPPMAPPPAPRPAPPELPFDAPRRTDDAEAPAQVPAVLGEWPGVLPAPFAAPPGLQAVPEEAAPPEPHTPTLTTGGIAGIPGPVGPAGPAGTSPAGQRGAGLSPPAPPAGPEGLVRPRPQDHGPPPVAPTPPAPPPKTRSPYDTTRALDPQRDPPPTPPQAVAGVLALFPDLRGLCAWRPMSRDFVPLVESIITELAGVWRGIVESGQFLQRRAQAWRIATGSVNPIAWVQQTVLSIPDSISDVYYQIFLSDSPLLKRVIPDRGRRHAYLALMVYRAGQAALSGVSQDVSVGYGASATFRNARPEMADLVDRLISYICPTGTPSLQQAVQLALNGQMGEGTFLAHAALANVPADVARDTLDSARARPEPGLTVRDWQRYRYPIEDLHRRLREMGWLRKGERQRLIDAHEHIPSPSDLISFAVRDVYFKGKLGRDEMLKEYREQAGLRELFASQGIGEYRIVDGAGKEHKHNSGEDYWLAHYHNVSPTQAFHMLHRLRPDRVSRYALPGPGGRPITPKPVMIEDVQTLLKEDDYNPIWRDRLAAISYHTMTRVDVRRVYSAGGFGTPNGPAGFRVDADGKPTATGVAELELVAQNQDAGYVIGDAQRLAYHTAREHDKSALGASRAAATKGACDLYQMGGLTREQAVAAVVRAGATASGAEAQIRRCDLDARLRDMRAALRVARKLFLRGEIDAPALRAMLGRIGVGADRVADHVRRWEIELAGQSKEVTAQTMCGWLEAGLLTGHEMYTRLVRSGYAAPDAARIVRLCEAKTEAQKTKPIKAAVRAAAARIKPKAP